MKASTDQLAALRLVARRLGKLREDVVFIGGMTAGLLITSPGAPTARPTDDIDVILEIASTAEYQTRLRKRLRARGFREDTRPGAPLCRWMVDGLTVDVMPTDSRVLGFSNEWYAHAIRTASAMTLPADDDGPVVIRVIAAPTFLATKLAAWRSRGQGDLQHHDIEDVVSVVDGRLQLLTEIEGETMALRKFVADAVASLFQAGFDEHLAGHLPADPASQARLPWVLTTFRRLERCPRILKLGQKVVARSLGDPGATTVPDGDAWDWEISGIVTTSASKAPIGSSHIAVIARLRSRSSTAGVAGDGRRVLIEDETGRRFPPLYKLLGGERAQRGMAGPNDQILPDERFETAWI